MIGSGGDVLTSIRSPIRMEEYGHLFNVYFLLFLISLCCKCIAIFFKSMKGRWILHGAFERHSGQEKCCKLVLHYHNRARFLPGLFIERGFETVSDNLAFPLAGTSFRKQNHNEPVISFCSNIVSLTSQSIWGQEL